jgi:putative MATE family efflux protein
MLSNFMMTFYNITDAFWLGKLGDNARDAVSVAGLAFPLIFFLSSFGFGFVIAGTALIAQYKGAGQYDKLKQVVGQFIIIILVFMVIFISGSLIFLNDILTLLQVPTEIFTMAKEYISVILFGIIFMFVFMAYQSFSHGLGDTVSPMKIMIISVLVNVFIDPLFIFGIPGFFPRLETLGAAYATLIARIIGAIMAVSFMFRKNPDLIPKLANLKPDFVTIKKILNISIPASLSHSMTSFGFLILQGFVNSFGTVVIAIFAIGNRMTSLFMMPAMGISNALATIVGQNLGADNTERAEKSVSKAMLLVLTIMGIGCTILFLFGAELTRFFINDAAVIEIGQRMFKVTSIASFLFGIIFVFMGVFNGSGHTKPAMVFNISRLWLFRIPLVFILSGRLIKNYDFTFDFVNDLLVFLAQPLSAHPYDALWWSMVISNLLTGIWAFLLYKRGKWKIGRI